MSLVRCARCPTKIRSDHRSNGDGLCYPCRKKLTARSMGKRPMGCMFCIKPRFKTICDPCARAYDRWQRSPENRGDHWSLMRWVARRVRRFTKLALPEFTQEKA